MTYRSHLTLLPIVFLGLVNETPAWSQTITPFLDCAKYDSTNNTLTAFFGYKSTLTAPVSIPIGPQNFFSPGILLRNQPTTFNPGTHKWVFQTSFQVSASQPQITWFLNGNFVVALADETVACDLPVYRGGWDPTQSYVTYDMVKYQGSFWILPAMVTANAIPPGSTGSRWVPADPVMWLGALSKLPIVPSMQVYTLPAHGGSLTINDPAVTEGSLIIAQFLGGSNHKEKSEITVDSVSEGKFTVSSPSGGDFRYVIFN